MPCYEQRRISANLNAFDLTILESALKQSGFNVWLAKGYNDQTRKVEDIMRAELRGNSVTIYLEGERRIEARSEEVINKVKQAYAWGVVQEARRFGWDLEVSGETVTLSQQSGGDGW